MDYEKAYKHALDLAKQVHDATISKQQKENIEIIFPELRKSEDEKIRKMLIEFFGRGLEYNSSTNGVLDKDIVRWLEKQGKRDARFEDLEELLEADTIYQMAMNDAMVNEAKEKAAKSLSKLCIGKLLGFEKKGEQNHSEQDLEIVVVPKFKVGDWVILTTGELSVTLQIVNVDTNKKLYWFNDKSYLPIVDEECLHHWIIQYAKDGDVLVASDDSVFIYAGSTDRHAQFYIALSKYGDFNTEGGNWEDKNCVKPATKEQRDLLFQKMKEAGYTFDFEKKELKKIHMIDEGKAEMDYCFTKMMNGEKVSSAWSKKDEEIVTGIIKDIQERLEDYPTEQLADIYFKEIKWLKSIKERVQPQNHWTPSDEQMKALADALSLAKSCGEEMAFDLRTLYEQLKKL